MSRLLRDLPFLIVLAVAACIVGCSATDALAIFTQKGLVPLQPARTWVTTGGLFVVGTGQPGYIDADASDTLLSNPASQEGNCMEEFGDETQQQTMAFNVAVSAIAKIIPYGGGLQAKNATMVHLMPIDSPCVRLNARAIPNIANEPINKPVILSQLHQKNRVFMVLEVDSTKSLTLTADRNVAFNASFQGSGSLPSCSDGTAGNTKSTTNSKATTTKSTATNAKATGAATVKGTNASGGGDSGISVGACLNTVYSLTLKTDTAVPFAVRLSEIVETVPNSGLLDVKYTGFKFPAKSLSSGTPLEQATAKLDANLLDKGYTRLARNAR